MRSFPPSHRHRHPLARLISLVVGIALLGLMLVFGLVAAGVLLVGGGLWLALRRWQAMKAVGKQPASRHGRRHDLLEGDFVVLHRGGPASR